jgi:nucleoside-diphosphate-sugar epimerase
MPLSGVLVLGATGRIGRALQQCWGRSGGPDPILWQCRPGHPTLRNQALSRADIDILQDPDALARAAQGRAVILCLAGGVPGRGDLRDNAALAAAAVRAGARVGARVILTSSAAVYGAQSGLLGEQTPCRPLTEYGRAKAEMEAAGGALGRELGVPVCCLRIGNIAGLDAALGGWQPGFRLDRFADGRTPQRSYIGVQGLARVLAGLCTAAKLPDALNVAAPGAIEMGALLDAADLGWTARPAPDSAIAKVLLDVTALQRILPIAQATAGEMVTEWRILEPYMA